LIAAASVMEITRDTECCGAFTRREAALLTIDGVGEWTTASLGIARSNDIKLLKEIRFPHSVGFLYSAFTAFFGF